jgi:ABC-2 type transport system permease protein
MSAVATPPSQLRAATIIVRHAFHEAVRRRVLVVVLVLTAAFLVLYAVGAHYAFDEDNTRLAPGNVDGRALDGATLLGLAMFATLFLGAVLATFLTMGVVRGDAETGMLQPLVARPANRSTILLARIAGAAAISAVYVVGVYAASAAITSLIGHWTPDRPFAVGAMLALAVVVIAFISLVASVWLSATAQGIAVLMVYGGGITAGLLGQIGDALNSDPLERIADWVSWVLPFEGIYQSALHALTADTGGVTGIILNLGPFGGGKDGGVGLLLWTVAYLTALAALAVWGFRRRDL